MPKEYEVRVTVMSVLRAGRTAEEIVDFNNVILRTI